MVLPSSPERVQHLVELLPSHTGPGYPSDMAEPRTVTVPIVIEQDEDGVWCAHAQLPLPSISGARVVRALERPDFKIARVGGSHHIMRHPDGRGTTVPVHGNRDLAKGTLRGILSDVGLTIEELAP